MYMDFKKYLEDKRVKYPVFGLIAAAVTLEMGKILKKYLDRKNFPERARKVGAI